MNNPMPDEREAMEAFKPKDHVGHYLLGWQLGREFSESSREAAEAEVEAARQDADCWLRERNAALHEIEPLREALEGAEDFIERVEKWSGSDPDELDELRQEIAAALSPREDALSEGTHIDLIATEPLSADGPRLIRRTQPDDPDIGKQVREGWATYVAISEPHTMDECPFGRTAMAGKTRTDAERKPLRSNDGEHCDDCGGRIEETNESAFCDTCEARNDL